jgi:hypothetical protein
VAVKTVERLRVGSVAALASLALHGLLLAPALVGHPADRTQRAHRVASDTPAPSLTAFILNDRTPAAAQAAASLQPDAALIAEVPIELPTDPTPDLAEPAADPHDPDPTADASQETTDRTVTYIRRMSQITARIQGAWTLPPTRLATDFHCRIRIRQDAGEAVSEVEFESCDSDGTLRASLLKAIDHLGSMPALSEKSVGTQDVTLDVTAFAAPSSGRRTSVEPGASFP